MTNAELQIKVKERLNKLASQDYENIQCWQIAEAFNKAQLEWFRRQISGINQRQQGEGTSKLTYDDTQRLSVTTQLPFETFTGYCDSGHYPDNYMFFDSIMVVAKNDCCPERDIVVYLIDKADLQVTLRDANKKPSFEWAETVATLADDVFTVYTNDEFVVTEMWLTYYRKPIPVSFENCVNVATGLPTADVPCEFKDDIAEILVDNAVAILAADIESFNQYTRATNSANQNT